ncbi:MAG: DUF192 domain-containing protein [Actinomycetota bacterium]
MAIQRVLRAFAVVVLLSGPAAWAAEFGRSRVEVETAGGHHQGFTVEVATTPDQLSQGLMFRKALAPDAGMLFDFGHEQQVAMWMKNTLIPLDMLFIASDGRIIHIAEYTVPGSLEPLGPRRPVRAVLEVNAGTANRLGIHTGDHVSHALFAGAN